MMSVSQLAPESSYADTIYVFTLFSVNDIFFLIDSKLGLVFASDYMLD